MCDTANREDEATRSGLQLSADWSEGSKKRRQKIKSPKESGRVGSRDQSPLQARRFDEGGRRCSHTRVGLISVSRNHEAILEINKVAGA